MNRVFKYTIQDTELYEDPLKVRRILLEQTDGRCWAYINDLKRLKDELVEFRKVESEANEPEVVEKLKAVIALNLLSSVKLEGVLAHATAAAFNFSPLDLETGEGVTERESLDVLRAFMEYAEGKE